MTQFPKLGLAIAIVASIAASALIAQGASVAFGSAEYDRDAPVEVSADRLDVDQDDGSAVFSGNVVVVQDALRLSAGTIRIEYSEGEDAGISRLLASGGVTLVSGEEAAEAAEAVYSFDDSTVVMTGNVLLTQARSAISGDRLTVDLTNGTGLMEGRVRTILQTGRAQ